MRKVWTLMDHPQQKSMSIFWTIRQSDSSEYLATFPSQEEALERAEIWALYRGCGLTYLVEYHSPESKPIIIRSIDIQTLYQIE